MHLFCLSMNALSLDCKSFLHTLYKVFIVIRSFLINKAKHFKLKCNKLARKECKRALGVNFCRTFISSISLILELADSNLAHALLSSPEVIFVII